MAANPFGAHWYGWDTHDPRLTPTVIGIAPTQPTAQPVRRHVPIQRPLAPHAPACRTADEHPQGQQVAEPEPATVRIRRIDAPDASPLPTGNRATADVRARLHNALAELEAAKARVERDAGLVRTQTQAKLVADLLPVLDNLGRSIKAATGSAPPALLDGLRMVVEQFEGVLRGYGLERVQALGQPFDPSVHEAVAVTPVQSPEDDRRIVDEITPGYRFDAHLLRPATVRVGKLVAPTDEGGAPDANEQRSSPPGDCL